MHALECDQCNKKFEERSKLARHLRLHTGVRPYTCPYCERKFALDFNMRTHMRTHTGAKPYHCPYPGCQMRSTQSGNIGIHMKVVHGKGREGAYDEFISGTLFNSVID